MLPVASSAERMGNLKSSCPLRLGALEASSTPRLAMLTQVGTEGCSLDVARFCPRKTAGTLPALLVCVKGWVL